MQQRLVSVEQELKQFHEETKQYYGETKQYYGEAYKNHIPTWMLLRGPIYKSPHGGSVLVDLDILRFLANNDASEFAMWAGGFELIYGMSYSHGKFISRGSKMVRLADTRADLKLLDNQACLPKCDAIIRLWKAATDNGQDPEGVFRTPAVAGMYDNLMRSFRSAPSK
ncbi:hypothetical protein H112_01072 [Trichophyton rubrum D6]|uniref:Uncharacterized protein n=4 Tax=Trichophyton TaxID=5550 RepID=A0A178F569_TRIRU|nr:uncharacterized protein TERG_07497 [Trichophyton rubrum CBS 118892]EZF26895.1 hypothetical protein H100_01072 [Trichophyton rubrum MR850]EZF45892.1 hypothetical protein H102_01062 [Trichophyton rubrum CBS 100081]EZF56567.1 hypothetical protein H103_01070 [Trichophyton rubrum CBS 288.86]EZF67193.1 hypothetical protein H104_01055 [Trichophyton rubrum CBS 289.86]EZF77795.1 hypothetical protein H105_01074 [Trichophyton soudanense CBS 452.61]EZF88472.1 hypothetical protein H110_01072 [Trichophy